MKFHLILCLVISVMFNLKAESMFHSFKLYPSISDRAFWDPIAVQQNKKQMVDKIFEEARKAQSMPIPECRASVFMEFYRNGNRSNYEEQYFKRRHNLLVLTLAEVLENKGNYLDDCIDYIHAILCEHTWSLPGHCAHKDPLPFADREEIDLFSAQTSNQLAQVLMLMEDRLTAVSPQLVKRMKLLIFERAILPVEEDLERYWWTRLTSNWNVWICSNLLWTANTMLQDDPARFSAYAEKLIQITNLYYQHYSNDGGCIEGANYWTVSPVCYFLFNEALYRASDGKYNKFTEEKFRRMCEFIVYPSYAPNSYVIFSDGTPRLTVGYGILALMAERYPDSILNEILADTANDKPNQEYGGLETILGLIENKSTVPGEKRDYMQVYPDLQQVFARSGRYFIAAKAGHNQEGDRHNHFDVGQFVFAIDGKLAALDLGTDTYTKDTFNENRYRNDILNSNGHNPLRFNGIGQKYGHQYAAKNFRCEGDAGNLKISMDLTDCYEEAAQLLSYTRTITFDGTKLQICDEYSTKEPVIAEMTIFSEIENPQITSNHKQERSVTTFTDPKLIDSWGKSVTRIDIRTEEKSTSGVVEVTLQ